MLQFQFKWNINLQMMPKISEAFWSPMEPLWNVNYTPKTAHVSEVSTDVFGLSVPTFLYELSGISRTKSKSKSAFFFPFSGGLRGCTMASGTQTPHQEMWIFVLFPVIYLVFLYLHFPFPPCMIYSRNFPNYVPRLGLTLQS